MGHIGRPEHLGEVQSAAAHADRIVFLADGNCVDEMATPTVDRILERMKSLDGQTD